MPKPTTALARLNLLLPWLNGAFDEHYFEGRNPEPVAVRTDFPAIRRGLREFVKSFDGSAEAAYVVAEPDDTMEELDDEAIGDLEAKLKILLDQGFGKPSLQGDVCALPLTKLRVAVLGAGRREPAKRGSIADGGAKAKRAYRAPGAYVLRVKGPTFDLVPFLLVQLLTAPNMVTVRSCERPGCMHLIAADITKAGRPRRFCSDSCWKLNEEQVKQQRTTRRKS